MKTITTIFFLILMINFSLKAQKITATDENENIGGGINPAISVVVYETDESTVQKEWKSLMKKHDAKVSKSGDETFADNALIKDIRSDTLDVYSKTKKEDTGVKLLVAMKSGEQFLSPSKNSGETSRMKKLLEDFARKLTKKSIMEQHKEAEKIYDKAMRSHEELVRENKDLHRDIENYKDKIQKAEEDIKKNLQAQENAKKEIEQKKKLRMQLKRNQLRWSN